MAPRSIFSPLPIFYLARAAAFLPSGRSGCVQRKHKVKTAKPITFSATVSLYFPREQQRASSAAFVECKQGVRSLRRARKLRREPHRPFCPCTRLVRSLPLSLFPLPSLFLFHSPPAVPVQASLRLVAVLVAPRLSFSRQPRGVERVKKTALSPFAAPSRVATVRGWRSWAAFTVDAASSLCDPWRCNGDATGYGGRRARSHPHARWGSTINTLTPAIRFSTP